MEHGDHWQIVLFFMLVSACSAATTPRCPPADDPTPVPHEPTVFQSGDSSSLRGLSQICVSAEDRESGNDSTSDFLRYLATAGADVKHFQVCSDKSEHDAAIHIETTQSFCADCGACSRGPRFVNVAVRVGSGTQYSYEAQWTDTRGGSMSEVLNRSAHDLFALFIGAGAATQFASPPDVSQLCSVTIEARGNQFIFVNPRGLPTIRTVGSLEDAIQVRRAGYGRATLQARSAPRRTNGVTYQLEWGVPQTIWSSVKQPRNSSEATVPAGRYQAVIRYISPGNDRVLCEAVSAPVDLPRFLILTTD
jgi:hypothetical protein